ncbi:MAG: cofactor-independent phosphoglycerate mutase [Oscillospiraceae bacterium]|jgi:2,3-bisphosphoglycerate-independent phosphoglycerate mutase|nr:cofactor-independent phosphoglycerate mutase [Oscillospiraceae bacterium]
MKYVLIIGDGMADDPILELKNKTPLQYAKTPTMDKLASFGVFGNVLTVPEGLTAGSDTAILSIFGYDPKDGYGGRAALEAAAMGIKMNKDDIAYRCNMITIEDGKIISHSAGSIEGNISDTLITELFENNEIKEIADKASIKIYPGNSFRHIAIQSFDNSNNQTKKESFNLTKLIPPHDHLFESYDQLLPKETTINAKTLKTLMLKAHEILDVHPINKKRKEDGKLPANGIWFWAEGETKELPKFYAKYNKTGAVISAVPLCQGIGVLIGLEKIIVKGATGELNTNYEGKVEAVIEALKTHDFVTVHVEAPDECTHNGDLKGKLQAIEWIDSRIVAPIYEKLKNSNDDFKILLMTDHRTLISTRSHANGAVPYAIYDSRNENKTNLCFNEFDAKKGTYIKDGTKLLDVLFNN